MANAIKEKTLTQHQEDTTTQPSNTTSNNQAVTNNEAPREGEQTNEEESGQIREISDGTNRGRPRSDTY